MAIKVQYISHWALNVHDMKTALDFYCGILGFTHVEGYKRDDKPWIEYVKVAKNRFIELFHPGPDLDYYSQLTSFRHICLEVKDIHQIEKTLKNANWPIDQPIKQGKDKNQQMWSHDPEGNKIEFMQMDPESLQAKA